MSVCGTLQRLQRAGVKEKIDNIHTFDAVVVKRRVVVEREQKFRVIVPDGAERGEFARESGFIADGICNLEVAWNPILDCDEVNLTTVEYAHIDFPEAAMKFKVDDFLDKMPEVFALGSKKCAAKAGVGEWVEISDEWETNNYLYMSTIKPSRSYEPMPIDRKALALPSGRLRWMMP